MANHPNSLPLYEKVSCKRIPQRVTDVSIFLLLLCLLLYRLLHFATQGLVWRLAFFSECWFTIYWFMIASTKWSPCDYKTYPERLLQRHGFEDLPALDMFVTTADSSIEPPIITVNTVLSLLAVDYPTQKLACYVSDDGCSVLTFLSLVEAAKFARSWVPFCKKYGVRVRAPFMYFSKKHDTPFEDSSDFAREWGKMKNEYEELRRKIEEAAQNPFPWQLSSELASFSNVERGNHSAIVKVIWENKEGPDGLPHIIYVAREKRPNVPHNSKAGAMNALIRVSGVMTNAPFILNVDCDMYVNNPQVALNAMCLLLGIQNVKQYAYVQFPQRFYGGLKDDPFGTSYIVIQKYMYLGTSGLQGAPYGGSGCFHRRKVLYGLSPPDEIFEGKKLNAINGNEAIERRFGHSEELSKSAARILNEEITVENPNGCNLQSATEAANVVAGSHYEFNTCWGQEVGLVYGSTSEDIVTGTKIHSRGWESAYRETDPPAFLGSSPSHGPSVMKHHERYTTGLMQVVLGRHNPLIGTLAHKLRFRQCLAYITMYVPPLRSLPELCYSLLPPFCLLTGTSFLPKVSDPVIVVPAALFLLYNLSTMEEYLSCGLSVRAWWNNQRMQRILSVTAWLFGVMGYCLDRLGLSEALFVVTPKDQTPLDSNEDEDDGKFTFDSSSIFIPGVALLFVQLTALAHFLLGLQPAAKEGFGSGPGLGEVVCSLWLVLSFLPFVRGLFRRGSHGIPWPTIFKAAALTFLFVQVQFFKYD